MKKQKEPKDLDCCIACKTPMHLLSCGGEIEVCFICVNPKCPRVGLLSVVGVKLVDEKKKDKKKGGGRTNGELPNKNAKK